MFPIVPYNLLVKSGDVASSDSNGSLELLVPGRVTSSTFIPQGAMSMPIEPSSLLGSPPVVQISVKANSFDTIEVDESCKKTLGEKIHWVRSLRLSDDCHNYNVQLRLLPSQRLSNILNKSVTMPKLILQTVRTIEPGQELLLWFSEDILAMLQIAFLTPSNIQGQGKYVCNRCSTMYESPNPLKLHITLSCGRYDIATLWEKLSSVLAEETKFSKNTFSFRLSPDPPVLKQKKAIDLTVPHLITDQREEDKKPECKPPSPCTSTDSNFYRPFLNNSYSAFKPFQKSHNSNNNSICLPTCTGNNPIPIWPLNQISHDMIVHACATTANSGEQMAEEAHLETVVSSMGKSKQGHICLYCGKCYSRKYGLKIHIRTHTGYKPLKCKFCLRPFGDPSNLNKHVRLHAEGDTPYKCDLCGKILVRRRDLERHLRSRHIGDTHPTENFDENTNSGSGDDHITIDD